MQTRCPSCYKWTTLPQTGPANGAFQLLCDQCQSELPYALKDRHYQLCRVCGQRYLRAFGICPICPPPGDAVAVPWLRLMLDQAGDSAAAKLQPRPLSENYCNALWVEWQNEQSGARERVQAGSSNSRPDNRQPVRPINPVPAPTPPPILPPEPVALFELPEVKPAGTNGNGHSEIAVKAHEGLDDVEYELISDQGRLAEVADLLSHEHILSVDTETDGLDPFSSRLLLLQISTAHKCYIIDCQRLNPLPLKALLESNSVLKLLQNAKFDYKMLKHIAGIELGNIFDTMLAERLLTAGRAREIGLKALASKYAGVTMDKTIRKSFVGVRGDGYLSPEQLTYAARDALILFDIYRQQKAALQENRLIKVDELENKCVAAVGDMELAGLVINVAGWRNILAKVAVERDRAAEELNELLSTVALQATMFGVPVINLNSNSQLIEAFGRLGIALEDTREQTLVKQGDKPAIKKLLDYRGHEKTLSAFGEELLKLINSHTNRMHPDFNQYGADTGRFSCTNPNVQQIPATSDFRSCFVAAEGYKLVTCDYSQAELRILAELSGDPGFVEAFVSGGDLHAITASQMFQVPLENVSKPQRSAAKSINFGLAYGRGPGSLALQLGVSPDEARALIEKYFQAYQGVAKWLDKAARDAVRKGYSETTLGRKRFYDVPTDKSDPEYRTKIASIERQGKNTPIQGGNADMTKIALIYLRENLRGYNARIVNTVHDEIVVEAIEDQAEEVKHIVEAQMIRAGQEILQSVPVVADAAVGDYWKK